MSPNKQTCRAGASGVAATPGGDAPRGCATCRHFEESRLKSYGYCKAAQSLTEQGRLLVQGGQCVFGKWGKK